MNESAGHGLHVLETARMLADEAADLVEETAREATRVRGRFTCCLSGGNTPRFLYRILDLKPRWGRIDWSRTEIYFGDERCVDPKDPASNYRMAWRSLLRRIPLRDGAVHRIQGELGPEKAADLYEAELREEGGGDAPRFDLVLLGLGSDGHCASLFPHSEAIKETERLAIPVQAPIEPRDRVTLTLPVFNAARKVAFLVTGREKAETLSWVMRDLFRGDQAVLPAARIRPTDGELHWLADKAATPFLQSRRDPNA